MGGIASQIISLTIAYSTDYSGADQRKHQRSASPAFVRGIHRGPAQMASNVENVSIRWRHHDSSHYELTRDTHNSPLRVSYGASFRSSFLENMLWYIETTSYNIVWLMLEYWPDFALTIPPNLAKSRNRDIGCYNCRTALKLDRHLGSAATEGPVKFQSDWKSLNPNLATSRLYVILQ